MEGLYIGIRVKVIRAGIGTLVGFRDEKYAFIQYDRGTFINGMTVATLMDDLIIIKEGQLPTTYR